MPPGSADRSSPLVLLAVAPLAGTLLAMGAGCAPARLVEQAVPGTNVRLVSSSVADGVGHHVQFWGSPEVLAGAVPCASSGLDLPSRLHSSESFPVELSPGNVLSDIPTPPWVLAEEARTAYLCDRCRELPLTVWCDYRNFYSCSGVRDLVVGLGVGAVLANTSLDQGFRDWYQERIRTEDTNRFAEFWKHFGDGMIVVPSIVGLAVAGTLCDDTAAGDLVGQFGLRATRAYLVGTPPMLFGQWALGGARPGESARESRWSPFKDDHAISGHAFVGGVPLITAAKMADSAWLKLGFYGLSVLPAWSRVNDDLHYLSQAALGWWMAYLACSAVDATSPSSKPYTLVPLLAPDTVGVQVVCPW